MQGVRKQKGFTIVELLIVVVVIAILAAIVIVSYNGITNQAKKSAVVSATSQAVRKIETFKSSSDTETYPATIAAAGLGTVAGIAYYADTTLNTYCVEVTQNTLTYSATNSIQTPTEQNCTENGLIGWWRFNGNGDDSSGKGLTANVYGTAAVGQNGQAGGAIDFNGTPPSSNVPGSQDILTPYNTFSFWYNADTWNTAAATSFVAKRSGSSTGHFIMRLTASNSISVDCGGMSNRWTPNVSMPLGAWAHVVVVCTPTQVSAYINGSSIGSASRTAGNLYNVTSLQFAQDNTNYGLDGRMDDIRLFNRVLSAGEVQRIYSEGAK